MARRGKKMISAPAFLGALIISTVCSLAGSALAAAPDLGVFDLRIKDHRDAIADFSRLQIAVEKILLSRKAGFWRPAWKEFAPSTPSFDLTRYSGKTSATIFRASIEAGSYEAVHVKIQSIDGVLKKPQRNAAVKNTVGPLKLSFAVPARGETLLILDLTVTDYSDHPPRGYELEVNGLELYTDGKLVQKIPPA